MEVQSEPVKFWLIKKKVLMFFETPSTVTKTTNLKKYKYTMPFTLFGMTSEGLWTGLIIT